MRIPNVTHWVPALALGLAVIGTDAAAHAKHEHHEAAVKQPEKATAFADIDLRDRALVDQDGREVRFVSDVIGDKIVIMDFVYTHCTNVCPILSAVLGQVQQKLGGRLGDEVVMVSVTVDPIRDTPQRLKAYAAKHRAGAGWTWLTGPKPVVDDVLTGLGAYSANFEDHPSMVLVGDGRTGEWSRLFGFPSPDRIVGQVDALQAARKVAAAASAAFAQAQAVKAPPADTATGEEKARQYFTDLEVIDQNGRRLRFYSDVLKDRVVLINFIYTSCRDACPLVTQKLIQIRQQLVDAVKDDIWFLSVSIDPERDTPQALKKYARQQGVDESRWLFLTGSEQNMTHIVKRLGQYTENIAGHSTLMLAGNTRTHHWTKVMPMIPPDGVAAQLRELAEERPG